MMLKKYKLPWKVLTSLLFIYITLFISYYKLIPKAPQWTHNLLIIGFILPIIYFLNSILFYSIPIIIIGILLNSNHMIAIISKESLKIFDFFIQWFLFIWGLEIGRNIQIKKHFKNSLPLLFITPAIFGISYFFTKNIHSSIFLALILSSSSSLFIEKIYLTKNFMPYILAIIYLSIFVNFDIGIISIIYLFFVFIIFNIYDLFLVKKVKLHLFMFFLSFITILISFSVQKIPTLIFGFFTGAIFYYKSESPPTLIFNKYYKAIIITLFLSQITFNLQHLLMSASIYSVLFITYGLIRKKIGLALAES